MSVKQEALIVSTLPGDFKDNTSTSCGELHLKAIDKLLKYRFLFFFFFFWVQGGGDIH